MLMLSVLVNNMCNYWVFHYFVKFFCFFMLVFLDHQLRNWNGIVWGFLNTQIKMFSIKNRFCGTYLSLNCVIISVHVLKKVRFDWLLFLIPSDSATYLLDC